MRKMILILSKIKNKTYNINKIMNKTILYNNNYNLKMI